MISRVEVKLKDVEPLDKDDYIKIESLYSFDSNGNKTNHSILVKDRNYISQSRMVKDISRILQVEEKMIDIIDESVIKDDEDTLQEELYKNGSLYPYEMPDEVDIREDRMTIFEWLRKLKKEQLVLNPEFQRHLVWKDKQKSSFIESVY
jgi:hypothetical protein